MGPEHEYTDEVEILHAWTIMRYGKRWVPSTTTTWRWHWIHVILFYSNFSACSFLDLLSNKIWDLILFMLLFKVNFPLIVGKGMWLSIRYAFYVVHVLRPSHFNRRKNIVASRREDQKENRKKCIIILHLLKQISSNASHLVKLFYEEKRWEINKLRYEPILPEHCLWKFS